MRGAIAGGDPLLEPGQALDRLAAWKGRIDQLAADTKTMSDRLGDLRVTASDEHRMVEVTLDSQGALLDIRLGRRIQQVEPEMVARAIMSTVREARQRIAGQAEEIISSTVGTGTPAARAIAAQVGEQLRDDRVEDGGAQGAERDRW
ncbi:YbaB/EbfC family nucleoid-associated protein [Winogradskya humida]